MNMTPNAKKKAIINIASVSGWSCYYCGKKLIPDDEVDKYTVSIFGGITPIDGYEFPELDHLHPSSRGGNNSVSNLVLSCGTCNHTKNNKTEQEYREWMK